MIRLTLDNATNETDILFDDEGHIAQDNGLETAALISILSDARSNDNAREPTERGGWWADNSFGSMLWTIRREKVTKNNQERALSFIKQSLQWMIDDGIASSVDVTVEVYDRFVLVFEASIRRKDDPSKKWSYLWSYQLEHGSS